VGEALELRHPTGALGEGEEALGVLERAAGGTAGEHLVADHRQVGEVQDRLVEGHDVAPLDECVQDLQPAVLVPLPLPEAHRDRLVEGAVHHPLGAKHRVAVQQGVAAVDRRQRLDGRRELRLEPRLQPLPEDGERRREALAVEGAVRAAQEQEELVASHGQDRHDVPGRQRGLGAEVEDHAGECAEQLVVRLPAVEGFGLAVGSEVEVGEPQGAAVFHEPADVVQDGREGRKLRGGVEDLALEAQPLRPQAEVVPFPGAPTSSRRASRPRPPAKMASILPSSSWSEKGLQM
jgi:hypothetical protein